MHDRKKSVAREDLERLRIGSVYEEFICKEKENDEAVLGEENGVNKYFILKTEENFVIVMGNIQSERKITGKRKSFRRQDEAGSSKQVEELAFEQKLGKVINSNSRKRVWAYMQVDG